MCHRTHQVGGGLRLRRGRLPRALGAGVYRKCDSFSDFWKTYAAVLPEKTHRSVGKETGHMERCYKTLCQRIARFVRETLSFSKKNWWHETGWTHWFIVECNLSCSE